VPRGNPVNGIGIVRYPDAVPGQLVPKSYRPGTRSRRRLRQLGHPPLQLLGPADERLPDPLALGPVERGENLAATGIADGEEITAPLSPGAGRRRSGSVGPHHPQPERVERADSGDGLAEAAGQPTRGRDPDPQAGERAGPEPDTQQIDPRPASRRDGTALDLLEQSRCVLRTALCGRPEQRLAEDLTIAPSAGGGVLGRGIEADDDQRGVASSP
jgi:hypothetical protein